MRLFTGSLLILAALLSLPACGDEDDTTSSGGLVAGGSGGGGDEGGSGEADYPDELGYDLAGSWQSLEPDVEGLYGVPPAFSCGTGIGGLYEVEGSVVLPEVDEGYRAARVYFSEEPEDGDIFAVAAPVSFDSLDNPTELEDGTAAVVIVSGSGPDALSWTSDGTGGTVAVEALNGATRPRIRWVEAGITSDDDGDETLSDGGHLKCD